MKMPSYFVSHGGGPWPYMPEAQQSNALLAAALRAIPRQLPRPPRAILAVSAHWETPGGFRIMAHPQPPMLYDYHGFPAHTYHVKYPAPGMPELAGRVRDLLQAAKLPAELDYERGFDHGAFVPLGVMYPDADIPIVQLSIDDRYDPARHIALGRALSPLREEDILILGSGLTYHNLRSLGQAGSLPSAQFDDWLQRVLVQGPVQQRSAQLVNWALAPAARQAHPREDHLIPLMVAVGAAENEAGSCVYHESQAFGAITASSFRFG